MYKNNSGFSLIELMITVAIIGVLASIAYPSYQESIKKSKRSEAKSELLRFSGAAEREYIKNGSYATTTTSSSNAEGDPVGTVFTANAEAAKHFDFKIKYQTVPPSFVLYAKPKGSMANDGPFLLKSTGEKGWAKNAANTVADAAYTSDW
jgi:type IV pilus assembly protein PilE